jgi:hypothetical protein
VEVRPAAKPGVGAASPLRVHRENTDRAGAARWPNARKLRVVLMLAAIAACATSGQQLVLAQAAGLPNEYMVKAVYLYNFGRYTEWPAETFASATAPFVIGILGEDRFGGALDDIAQKRTVQDRRIEVRRFASVAQYAPPCQVLFVSRSLSAEERTALLQKTQGTPVLIVGETPGFADDGGGANFFVDGDSVRFEINVNAARRSQLHMDPKLLNLGKRLGAQRTAATN